MLYILTLEYNKDFKIAMACEFRGILNLIFFTECPRSLDHFFIVSHYIKKRLIGHKFNT